MHVVLKHKKLLCCTEYTMFLYRITNNTDHLIYQCLYGCCVNRGYKGETLAYDINSCRHKQCFLSAWNETMLSYFEKGAENHRNYNVLHKILASNWSKWSNPQENICSCTFDQHIGYSFYRFKNGKYSVVHYWESNLADSIRHAKQSFPIQKHHTRVTWRGSTSRWQGISTSIDFNINWKIIVLKRL